LKNYVITIICVILGIGFYMYYQNLRKRRRKDRLIKLIEADWDNIKENNNDLAYMSYLHDVYKFTDNNGDMKIDDITWNDMEMDGIFDKINYTHSTMGEIYLYKLLRNPTNDMHTLKERDEIIEYFSKNAEARVKKQYQLNNIGKINKISIYEYRNLINAIKGYAVSLHILIPSLQIFSIISLALNNKFGILFFAVALILNLSSYYKSYKKIENYLPIIMQIGSLLESIKAMDDMQGNSELEKYAKILSKSAKLTKTYERYYRFFGYLTFGKIPDLDMLYDTAIKPFLHIDIIVFNNLIKYIKRNMSLIIEAYETVGFLDCMISIAAFRHKVLAVEEKCICKPEFCFDKILYKAEEIYNPLIKEPVTNSIAVEESVLITGSNATGKSTFLRTIGINAILAQTIYTVCAKSYYGSTFTIMSSMNLKDNIYSGDSYYMMEIKSLKRILDAISDERPILCCIDEVLRGTNTIERIAASSKILESLARSKVLSFVASHDLELTYIVEDSYKNYHFQENVDDYGMVCDFKLYSGRSYTRNAINLLKFIGYSEEIIVDAKNRANNYIKNGRWI
jgi:DNA mismatch repair ATPase MutS